MILDYLKKIPLTNREKLLLFFTGTLLLIGFIVFVGTEVLNSYNKLELALQNEEQIEEDLKNIYQSYSALDIPIDSTIFLKNMESNIIALLTKYELRENTGALSPRITSVDNNHYDKKTISLSLKDVPAEAFLNLLYAIEHELKEPKVLVETYISEANTKSPGLYQFRISLVSFADKR